MNQPKQQIRFWRGILTAVFWVILVGVPWQSGAESVINSPHNLSAGSMAVIKTLDEERVCTFCHVPHHATILSDPQYPGPLWGRSENFNEYELYTSPTILGRPGQPQGPSRLCLSCHDGTIALGAPASHGTTAVLSALSTIAPDQSTVLGTNLADDHPISIEYGANPAEFNDASLLRNNNIRLYSLGGSMYVECTSCHDPHDNRYGNFMVLDTTAQADALCTACHNKRGWDGSAHQTGGSRYSGSQPVEVAANGCVNCHDAHSAEQAVDLLSLSAAGAGMDSNCLYNCHNGVFPYSDISGEFDPSGRYVHPLNYDSGSPRHTANEDLPLPGGEKHVHCVDCHNPHQTSWQDAPLAAENAPSASGVLAGVRGVDISGNQVAESLYEYQVCFRCHSGPSAEAGEYNDSFLQVERLYDNLDLTTRFNPATALSYHPVAGPSSGAGSSLLPGANTNFIYCNNCHASHGSTEPHMLRAQNLDTFAEGQGTYYPLCYSCHDESYLMNSPVSGPLHRSHVFGLHPSGNSAQVSCSACHDPHGVPFMPGQTNDNAAHLINFDLRYVPGNAEYNATNRSCSISGSGGGGFTCHPASVGNPAIYSPYPFTP